MYRHGSFIYVMEMNILVVDMIMCDVGCQEDAGEKMINGYFN